MIQITTLLLLLLLLLLSLLIATTSGHKKVFKLKHGPEEELNHNGLAQNSTKKKYSHETISYRKGPLLTSTTTVHTIFYGSDFTTQELTLYNDFLDHLSASRWWGITKRYYSLKKKAKTYAGNLVRGETLFNMGYPFGTALTDANIANIIDRAYSANGTGAIGINDIYVILTDRFVTQTSGFCSSLCGFHTYRTKSGIAQKYIYVGSPVRCPSGCSALSADGTDSPNGLFQMDSMLSIIAHELTETVTDPVFNGWLTNSGEENADLCAWTYGTVSTFSSTRIYNEIVGSKKYLIQRNWGIYPTQQCYQ